MAQASPTYTPQDALSLNQNLIHGSPTAAIQAMACDIANSMIWTFYPWSWTLKSLTAIALVDGTQDYTPTDTDILRPIRIQLVRTDTTPAETRELGFLANLSPELSRKGGLESNTNAGWYAANNFIRLMYAASIGTGQTLQLQGIYQKVPSRIRDGDLKTTLAAPDRYFNVFAEGVLWQLYRLTDDPRAGGTQYRKNGGMDRVYTGQLAVFMDFLLGMARTEDLATGDQFMWPESPLGVGRSYWPGLYGL